MALGDMYQVTLSGTYLEEAWTNVFHAERFDVTESAQNVADSFAFSVFPAIRAFCLDTVKFLDIVVFNLDSPTDFHTQVLAPADGDRIPVNSAATFIAAGIRFPSTNRNIRSGHKRFVGLDSADISGGALDAAAIVLVQAIGAAMIGDWLASIDSHHVANYAIIKRICNTPAQDPCTSGYHLPETGDPLNFYLPNAALVNSEASSQVSRKKAAA